MGVNLHDSLLVAICYHARLPPLAAAAAYSTATYYSYISLCHDGRRREERKICTRRPCIVPQRGIVGRV